MARHYGIPYMVSKQKLVDKIVPFILKRHPGVDSFYDLFGGGGSVSLYVVRKYPNLNVHYNELSKAIGSLMEHLKEGGDIPFDFVERQEFDSKRLGDDWYAGFLQSCWSFGNGGKSYMYGQDIQDLKREISLLAMTGKADIDFIESECEKQLERRGIKKQCRVFLNPQRYKTVYQRRIVLARQIPNFGALQHMARLERLVQIENMPGISNLNITKGTSYDGVPITGNKPLLYCNPPYEDTAEYLEGGFDHKKFYDWCMAQPHPVYVSSYKVSDPRFKLVKAVNTRSLLAAAYSDKPTYNYENVYWNGVE